MASSRSMRSSRLSTPLSAQPSNMISVKNEGTLIRQDVSSVPDWQEPPLRPPAPSFEDYKGLERTGVLEYMQPLGTVPSQRVRLRLKAHDPPRRTNHARNGELTAVPRAGTEDMSTPDPAPPPHSRRSKSRKVDDDPSRLVSSRGKIEDSEYRPNGLSVTTPSKAVSSHSSQHGTPSSRTSMGSGKLMDVVESAVAKSNENGDLSLGLALRKLYKESLQNPILSDLLHAVLEQKPTQQQLAEFQSYMKGARKEVKTEMKLSNYSSQARRLSSEVQSMSPTHNVRNSKPKNTGDAFGSSKNVDKKRPTSHPHSPTKTNRHNAKSFSSEASSGTQQPPPNRAKRSSSTSSLSSVASSLSSVDANLALKSQEDFAASNIPLPSTMTAETGGRPKATVGPRMGTFSTSNKRSLAAIQVSKEDEELEAKRRKLTKTFPDYLVKDSNVRTRVKRSIEDESTHISSPPVLQHPGQQSLRLRNGMDHSGAGDSSDELDSPTTSVQSELLVPPPPFAGSSRRTATPTNLGRPPKAGKKSARVKMS